jgi:hypothetical protein
VIFTHPPTTELADPSGWFFTFMAKHWQYPPGLGKKSTD